MNNEIDYDDLDYVVLRSNLEYSFYMEKDPISFLNAIKEGEMSLEEANNRQKNYLYYLNIIRKAYNSPTQKKPYQILKIILMQERAQ